ncbi:hypothetical protein D3C72_2256620 [compost metagenome]
MRGAYRRHHFVLRQLHFAALQPLLQRGFRVLGGCLHLRVDLYTLKQAVDQRLGAGISSIQVHSTD